MNSISSSVAQPYGGIQAGAMDEGGRKLDVSPGEEAGTLACPVGGADGFDPSAIDFIPTVDSVDSVDSTDAASTPGAAAEPGQAQTGDGLLQGSRFQEPWTGGSWLERAMESVIKLISPASVPGTELGTEGGLPNDAGFQRGIGKTQEQTE